MKHLLTECYKRTKRLTGIDARTPVGFKNVVRDKNAFGVYAKSLSEGLNQNDQESFMILAENTRVALMENSMFQLNPYESFTIPILRNFYPRLIAKELVNVMPIDKPDVIKIFIHAKFKKYGESDFTHEFPVTDTDISRGPSVGISVTKTATVGSTDVLAEAGLTSANSHVEKDFQITGIYDSTANMAAVAINPTVDGNFSETVTIMGNTDVISGHIDFLNGILTFSSATGAVVQVKYQAYCALEENQINPTIKFEQEKIRFAVIGRRISAEWSIDMEQDVKALFDIQLQSEFVNIIGEQIALDIDREIINSLISANAALNPASHTKTFDLKPPTTFPYGRKLWYENVLIPLNRLSAQINNSTLMGAANTLACNPLDASVFEALNGFEYAGNSVEGGDLGYRSATVVGGKYKILVSSLIPEGKIITKYRSADLSRASLVYAPYVPALLTPFPLGATPSLTVMSRYSTKIIRHKAIGILNIIDTA